MQIKKITSLVLAAALSISLVACGNSQTTAVTSGQDNQQAESTQTADSSEAKEPESAQAENKTEDQQAETAAENESSAGNSICTPSAAIHDPTAPPVKEATIPFGIQFL